MHIAVKHCACLTNAQLSVHFSRTGRVIKSITYT
jgi:hypothetical protein